LSYRGIADGDGNTYFNALNVRITCIPQTCYGPPGVRIQVYNGNGASLYPGPEIPVANQAEAYQLMQRLVLAFAQLGV
jgi:hypothetical protein